MAIPYIISDNIKFILWSLILNHLGALSNTFALAKIVNLYIFTNKSHIQYQVINLIKVKNLGALLCIKQRKI